MRRQTARIDGPKMPGPFSCIIFPTASEEQKMANVPSKTTNRRAAFIATCALLALAVPTPAWASRSQDLQNEIASLSGEAIDAGNAASNAESNGDKNEACRLYRRAGEKWREAASAGTTLIIETSNDSNLDPDAVNENVHIMANNAGANDERADAVCR
ncbi:MAG: hypothetical protein K8S25_08360 [Alphaproteobacteria bacterium]|nr:hypothetical protein [Alphaproteobacteria bacterium]